MCKSGWSVNALVDAKGKGKRKMVSLISSPRPNVPDLNHPPLPHLNYPPPPRSTHRHHQQLSSSSSYSVAQNHERILPINTRKKRKQKIQLSLSKCELRTTLQQLHSFLRDAEEKVRTSLQLHSFLYDGEGEEKPLQVAAATSSRKKHKTQGEGDQIKSESSCDRDKSKSKKTLCLFK